MITWTSKADRLPSLESKAYMLRPVLAWYAGSGLAQVTAIDVKESASITHWAEITPPDDAAGLHPLDHAEAGMMAIRERERGAA